MGAWFTAFYNLFVSAFQHLIDFFGSGIVTLCHDILLYLLQFMQIIFYKVMSFGLTIISSLFDLVFGQTSFASNLTSRWGGLSAEARSFLIFFRLDVVFKNLSSAFLVRICKHLIPFLR